MSVDKSRQAPSEPTATAPRKRAVTERLHVFPPDPQRPAAAAAAPQARKPLRVTALLPLRSTREKNASLDDNWGEKPAKQAQGTAPRVANPAPLPVPAPKATPVAERTLAPIARLTPKPIAKPVALIAKPVAPVAKPVAKLASVPRPTAPMIVPAPKVQASPLKPIPRLAVGSNPPPVSDKPLPSLLSVIDRPKATTPMTAVRPSRLPGLPPSAPARPLIGAKTTAAASVVAASLTAAPMALAATRQTGPQSRVPAPAELLLDDEIEELDLEPDLPEAANGPEVAQMLAFAKTVSMAVPPPFTVRVESSSVSARPTADTVQMPAQQFSDAEAAFFAAGDELDTVDMMPEDVFDDLPTVDRPGFWSRLKSRANAR